jgi:hypothetical protein
MPPAEDSTKLSEHTRAAGIAFAATCAFTAAFNFMKKPNANVFSRHMGEAIYPELHRLNLGVMLDLVRHYNSLRRPAGTKVLNLDKPGANDLLFLFLQEIGKHNGTVGFQRTGALGFNTIALPLAEETVKMVSAATVKFGW